MKNLNLGHLIPNSSPMRNPEKPVNKEAMSALAAYYAEVAPRVSEGGKRMFTLQNTIMLGELYRQAWGVLPSAGRLKKSYNMPDYRTIERLFVDVPSYQEAITRYALAQPGQES
jgi:hypothetical protein